MILPLRLAGFLLASTLAAFIDGVMAAEWERVPSAGNDLHYYDRSKITIQGDEIVYWRKVVLASPTRVRSGVTRSAIYQERIHCRNHTLKSLGWQLFAADGAALEGATTTEGEAVAIVPETIGDRFQSAMCELVEARRRQQAEFAREETLLSAKRKELEALRAEVDRLEESVARLRARESALGDKPTEQTAATPQ